MCALQVVVTWRLDFPYLKERERERERDAMSAQNRGCLAKMPDS